MILPRRTILLSVMALPGCTALDLLSPSAPPRDIYELQPVSLTASGRRSSRSLLVLMPAAPAAIATDRILIKQSPLAVTYLPDAMWSDAVPAMLQSVLIRSIASVGQIGFVGAQGDGPVPDTVLLTRIDGFGVDQQTGGGWVVQVSFELTVLRDRDQRVLGTRQFAQTSPIQNDQADTIARAFQQILDTLLPDIVLWVLAQSG
ncbi:MAG: ABC-type transport auxiliary lipoprotein family protein [Pseudomonadota bacterium]